MKKYLLIVVIILISIKLFAQWRAVQGVTTSNLEDVYFVSADTGYIVGDQVIYKTVNGGLLWNPQTIAVSDTRYYATCFINQNVGWAIGRKISPIAGRIHYTTNGGQTWQVNPVNVNLGITTPLYTMAFANNQQGVIMGLEGIILYTSDGGTTFQKRTIPAEVGTIGNINKVVFTTNSTGYAVGNIASAEGFIIKTNDGGSTWSFSQKTTTALYGVYFSNELVGYAVGSAGKVLKTINGGNTWTTLSLPISERLNTTYFKSENIGWVAGFSGRIFSTQDGGNTWAKEDSSTTASFKTLNLSAGNVLWTVGSSGTIMYKNLDAQDSISGIISNWGLNLFTGDYNFSTKLKNKIYGYANGISGNPVIDSSNSSGFYSLNKLDINKKYLVKTKFDTDFWTNSKYPNLYNYAFYDTKPGTQDFHIIVPHKIYEAALDRSLIQIKRGYSTISSSGLFQGWTSDMGTELNNPEKVLHTMARCLIADSLQSMLYTEAETLAQKEAEMITETAFLLYSTMKSIRGRNSIMYERGGIIYAYSEDLKKRNEGIINDMTAKILSLFVGKINPNSSIEKNLLEKETDLTTKSLIKSLVYGSLEKGLSEFLKGNSKLAASWAIKKGLIQSYINNVNQQNIKVGNIVKTFDYKLSTKDAVTKCLSSAGTSIITSSRQSTYDVLERNSAIVSTVEGFDNVANAVNLLLPFSKIGYLIKGLNLAGMAFSTYDIFNTYSQIRVNSIYSGYMAFDPNYSLPTLKNIETPTFYPLVQTDKSISDVPKTDFLMYIDSVRMYVNNNDIENAMKVTQKYSAAETVLSNNLFILKSIIWSKFSGTSTLNQDKKSIMNRIDSLENEFIFAKIENFSWILAYLNQDNFNLDTFNISVESLISIVPQLDVALNNTLNNLSTIPDVSMVGIIENTLVNNAISHNIPFTITSKIKNTSSLPADNVWIKISTVPASVISDTIVKIGDLQPGEEKAILWNLSVTDPNTDFLYFQVAIDSTSSQTINSSGSILINDQAINNDIAEVKNRESTFVYPNPAKNVLFIKGLTKGSKISIYDLNGKKIFDKQITNSHIDISHLQSGIYTIKMESVKGIITKKFVKQ